MKRLLLAVMLCVGMLSVWAVPAKRISIEVKQPDGTVLTLTQGGDEFFSYLLTEDGVMVKRMNDAYYYAQLVEDRIMPSARLAHASSERSVEEARFVKALPSMEQMHRAMMHDEARVQRVRAARTPQKAADVPTHGEVHVPVLLVQYSDVKFAFSDAKEAFEDHINGDDYKDEGGYGSVKEYFEDQSEGKFMPKFEIIGPVTLSNKMEYYGGNDENGNDKNARKMVEEACRLANAEADFSTFDNNGDGYVDIVYVIYAGYGEASNVNELENTIWPHQWQLASPLSLDGVQISKYACNNALDGWQGNNMDGIGTFCHEFSHCLGLPDFYPTDGSNGFGMESWSLMHYGNYSNNGHTPCGYSGYEKDFLGWKELIVIDSPQDVTLRAMSEGGSAYKIVNDLNPDEYYVVENRQHTKWDEYVPAEGMLVIHVDYKASDWQNNMVNNTPSHQRMTIIPADNKLTRETQSGDTYPGTSKNTALTSTSTPAAKVYVGELMGKDITDISMNNRVVTFSFMKGALPVPVQYEATDLTSSGFTMSWKQAPGIEEYEVSLAVLEENPYMLDEDFGKFTKGSNDLGNLLDTYTNYKGWVGHNIYGLDGAIRMGKSSEEGILVSPYLQCDSSKFTVLFTIKKSEKSDKEGFMIMGVGDDAWGNSLFGFGIPVENEDWTTYFVVMDTIGKSSFLYLDTRDNDKTAGKECLRVDIDDIYLLAGDYSKELTGGGDKAPRKLSLAAPKQCSAKTIARMPAKASAVKVDEEDAGGEEKRYYATTIYTARTTDLNYRFDNLDGGLYRSSVRSVRDSIYSRYSNAVDVEIVDSMLPQVEVNLDIEIDNDSVTFIVDDPDMAIFYTLDGTVPTGYGLRYEAPFELKEKATIRLMGRKEGYRRSALYKYDNWFEQEGATYRIGSTIAPKAHLSDAMGGNDEKSYAGHFVVPGEVVYDSVTYVVSGIDSYAFRNAVSLRSVTVGGEALHSVGDGLFLGCKNLSAVVWDVDLPLAASAFDASGYNNLLVYLPETMDFEHPLIEKQNMTLVKGDVCATLVLNAQFPFYAPRTFNAGQVSFTRFFSQQTALGSSAGWETIALPFDVQHIEHSSKGVIAPFGVDADKHFWLAEPDGDGFALAEGIRANTAYIIAMPNHKDYGDNALSGQVTFSADNAVVYATDALCAAEGCKYRLMPTYDKLEADEDIYALNVGLKHDGLAPGSVFAPGRYAVNPFSAYLAPAENEQKAPMYRIQINKEIEDAPMEFSVMAKGGVVIVTLPEARDIEVYDIAGRSVCTIEGKAGANEITHLQTGFYLIEKTKVYVKH